MRCDRNHRSPRRQSTCRCLHRKLAQTMRTGSADIRSPRADAYPHRRVRILSRRDTTPRSRHRLPATAPARSGVDGSLGKVRMLVQDVLEPVAPAQLGRPLLGTRVLRDPGDPARREHAELEVGREPRRGIGPPHVVPVRRVARETSPIPPAPQRRQPCGLASDDAARGGPGRIERGGGRLAQPSAELQPRRLGRRILQQADDGAGVGRVRAIRTAVAGGDAVVLDEGLVVVQRRVAPAPASNLAARSSRARAYGSPSAQACTSGAPSARASAAISSAPSPRSSRRPPACSRRRRSRSRRPSSRNCTRGGRIVLARVDARVEHERARDRPSARDRCRERRLIIEPQVAAEPDERDVGRARSP